MPIADILTEVGINGSVTSLGAPGKALGATTINVGSTANWPTSGKAVYFAIRTVNPSAVTTTNPSGLVPDTYSEWKGVVGTNAITGMVLQAGSIDKIYTAGTNTQVLIPVTASRENALVAWGSVAHDLQGNLLTTAVQTALGLGTSALNGWNPLTATPNTVVANGNRSYTCTFNGVDLTGILSPGFRFRSTRTVAAGTQSTSLNGTTQFWSKAAPNGMTFTNNYTAGGWIKLNSYPTADATIVSRYDGTNGWILLIQSSGQVLITSIAGTNQARWQSFQSVPLNKWVHITATMDASGYTSATCKIFIDGVDIPAQASTIGVKPSSITQAGNLLVGAYNSTTPAAFFQGKIAQAAVFSSVLSQATIQSYYSQGLAGTEPTLISAFAFNGTAVDLNTTNANNLTANAAAGYATDAPWTVQASGIPNGTLDYGIVQSVSFATNTTVVVQVAEACALPTSGGVSAVAYSSVKVPFGFPVQADKWNVETLINTTETVGIGGANAWFNSTAGKLTVPVGAWQIGYKGTFQLNSTVSGVRDGQIAFEATLPTNGIKTQRRTTQIVYTGINSGDVLSSQVANAPENLSIQTAFLIYGQINLVTGTEAYKLRGDAGGIVLTAANNYL